MENKKNGWQYRKKYGKVMLCLVALLLSGCAQSAKEEKELHSETTHLQASKEAFSYQKENEDYQVIQKSTLFSTPGSEIEQGILNEKSVVRIEQIASKDTETWGQCGNGWVLLEQDGQTFLEKVTLEKTSHFPYSTCELMADVRLYAEPSINAQEQGRLYEGDIILLDNERTDSTGNIWGRCAQGWLLLQSKQTVQVKEAQVQPEEKSAEPEIRTETVIQYVPVPAPAQPAPAYEGTYLLPGSDSRYISRSEITSMSQKTLELARNELYARHGRMFHTDYIQNYFNSQAWYYPTTAPEAFSESVFNVYEKANLDLIVAYEREMGWRMN